MATLESLKLKLRETASTIVASSTPPADIQALSPLQYSTGFDILRHSAGRTTYDDFVIPELSRLLEPFLHPRSHTSVLEIGPGPEGILQSLPCHLRRKVTRYAACEPNDLFAAELTKRLSSTSKAESPLPCLESPAEISHKAFTVHGDIELTIKGERKFDVVLFCHSLYGMSPKHDYIKRALSLLSEKTDGAMVVVFHRGDSMPLDGLICNRTASFETGVLQVPDNDEVVDSFARFVAGHTVTNTDDAAAVQVQWRRVCRALSGRTASLPDQLIFSTPEFMATFTRHATSLLELEAQVPVIKDTRVKNREALARHPSAVCKPATIGQVQQCVNWALRRGLSLTVLAGGHSGQCVWSGIVAVDMAAFNQVDIVTADGDAEDCDSLVVAGVGCKSGDIIRKTMAAGLTVPLGSRPSVGAGLWVQGGIGHLARLYGLSCDAIVGAVMVSVTSGQVFYVGEVPSQYRPADAVKPANETELMWALKGAGTNFGIVINIVFKAYPAPTLTVRNWIVPLTDRTEARIKLRAFDEEIAQRLPRTHSVDAYLYWEKGQLHLGVTMYETSRVGSTQADPPANSPYVDVSMFGPEQTSKVVDGVGLFDAEMYMSGMHGGHGGGKTSSFKRCLFIKGVEAASISDILVRAIETRPSPFCYFHLLQGGGAMQDIAEDATAFDCRDWDFACVITGVWPRNLDGTDTARTVVQWAYDVAVDLLPAVTGVYGADLGPDPRDAVLAMKAFGPNRPRLVRLKETADPKNVLAYACPLADLPFENKVIVLVGGVNCAGKDYCAEVWASVLNAFDGRSLKARVVSISDTTKKEFAAATGADLSRLLLDRSYKEQQRPKLTTYFRDQVQQNSQLPKEQFLRTLYRAADADVVFVTGMRDEAPVATFSHLLPDSKMIEVRVEVSEGMRQARGGVPVGGKPETDSTPEKAQPCLIFHNEKTGDDAVKQFAKRHLLPFVSDDLQRLARMARLVPGFPRPGVDFRHVLDIAQHPDGLALCTSLLQGHFAGNWADVDAIAVCETGGLIFASALATAVGVPLILIREEGKLPPPTICVKKSASHISSPAFINSAQTGIEMEKNAVSGSASVVVIDDVLASGRTLCAVFELFGKAGIEVRHLSVMVVAEFPVHRGRELIRRQGFGEVKIQSLLVFGGA